MSLVHTKQDTHCVAKASKALINRLFSRLRPYSNSEQMYHKVISQICEKHGKKYSKELQVSCYGVTDRKLSEIAVEKLRLPITVDEFETKLSRMVSKSLHSAPVLAGAERLITHLYGYNIPMALATNSTDQAVRLHSLARPKLFSMFNHKVSVTDPEVDRGKPYPDIYLVAASRFPDKPKPTQCLVFEDSEVGVKAGINAGMQVVMIPDPRLDRERTRHATLVIRSLREFQPELFGLPPFDDVKKNTSPVPWGP